MIAQTVTAPSTARALSSGGASDEVAALRAVEKRYRKVVALSGVSLSLHAGEVLALLGPNGAGKTTAVGLLLGLIRADEGEVSLFGGSPQAANRMRA